MNQVIFIWKFILWIELYNLIVILSSIGLLEEIEICKMRLKSRETASHSLVSLTRTLDQ